MIVPAIIDCSVCFSNLVKQFYFVKQYNILESKYAILFQSKFTFLLFSKFILPPYTASFFFSNHILIIEYLVLAGIT